MVDNRNLSIFVQNIPSRHSHFQCKWPLAYVIQISDVVVFHHEQKSISLRQRMAKAVPATGKGQQCGHLSNAFSGVLCEQTVGFNSQ